MYRFCRSEYVFQFDQPFVISDDLDVLKKMGMSFNLDSGSCTPEDVVKAKELLPKPFERFLNGEPVILHCSCMANTLEILIIVVSLLGWLQQRYKLFCTNDNKGAAQLVNLRQNICMKYLL